MRRNSVIMPVIVACLAACLAAVAPPTTVHAQTANDLSRLSDYISRNAEMLQEAKELVSGTSSVKARQSLEAAARLHQQSVSLLNTGVDSRGLSQAYTVAKKAREVIHQTIALAKREAKLEESAIKALERATSRLERARQLRDETSSRDAANVNRLLEEAHAQLKRSQDNLREHLFEVALRLAVSSDEFSNRAIGIIKNTSSNTDLIERELGKTERILDRVGEQIGMGSDSQAHRMFGEAQDLQDRAKASYRANQPGAALEFSQQARRVALRAAKTYASKANDDTVQQALRLTDALLREAHEMAKERSADRFAKQIERAEQLQSDSKRQFDKGNNEQALKTTIRARGILKDSLDGLKKEFSRDDVEPALRGTDKLLNRLKEVVADAQDDLATDLLTRARSKQDKAWQSFRQGRLRAALANTRVARTLANQALRQMGYDT
jgi:F0F1-type ATP synthase membrane subunit b/b'